MTFIGQHNPATRAATCKYCGASYFEVPTGYGVCADCDTLNIASDLYKDEHGFRPHWSLPEARAFMRARMARREVAA